MDYSHWESTAKTAVAANRAWDADWIRDNEQQLVSFGDVDSDFFEVPT